MLQIIAGGVSVIIPAYNRAGLIGQTLSSLLNQTLPADEIIVVDDGSSDGTEDATRAAFHRWESEKVKGRRWEGGKLPEFKVIRQENAGPGAARNRGFAESKGEFIHFFDSDDIAAPNKHEVQVRALQKSGADIAYGPWVKGYMRERGAWSGELGASTEEGEHEAGRKRYSFEPEGFVFQQKGLPQGDLTKELLTRWSIIPQACLFRRSIVEKSGGFPNDIFVGEDQLMFLKCLLAGAKVAHTPDTLTFYRLGEVGKLTESPDGACRRAMGWGQYLISGAKMAAGSGRAVSRLGRFRARCFGAARDCDRCESGAEDISVSLRSLGSLNAGNAAYFRLRNLFFQWRGGVAQRLLGTREDRSFRPARMTADQRNLFPSR
jgi:GT2 family glycosyltransferase